MGITFRSDKIFTADQLKGLFSSVGWLSANYPERLYNAIQNSATVYTAWDGDILVGLVNAIDDGELTAYIHYLLVNPDYQSGGIGKLLIDRMKEKYARFLYLIIIAENKNLVGYYEKIGFNVAEGMTAMFIQEK